jgi:tripeptide aminopeptidase
MTLLGRFLKYVAIDTQSDPSSDDFPSTPGQLTLLRMLADELREMGAADVTMDSNGYVMATIPATPGCEEEPTIGFLAHVDTSPDAPGANVRPQIHEIHVGGNTHGGVAHETLITTDGTTLLGADDKAGVAEIMTAAEYLLTNSELRHGRVRVAFTPDEEIGRGVDYFDVAAFGADFAYTVDGGAEGELEYENFNAAEAVVSIRGYNTHPGEAKGKMINALRVAVEFDTALPASGRPETTEGYEGFYHLTNIEGTVSAARLEYIVRDHDRARFEARKGTLEHIAAQLDKKYGEGSVTVALRDQYYNMRDVVERRPAAITRAWSAIKRAGMTPVLQPIRGGTDGARLSFMGLPCPNLFTGGLDFHSLNERISLSAMQKAVATIIEIVRVCPA